MTPRKLSLLCDGAYEFFTLIAGHGGEPHRFASVKEALQFAAEQITEETELIVYNQLGKEIVHTSIAPATDTIRRDAEARL